VAWPGDQPSSFGGGGASVAREPDIEEPLAPVPVAAKEETTPEEIQPSTPVVKLEQPTQDSSAAQALDLNEVQP